MYEKMKAELLKRLHAKEWAYSMRLMQKGYICGLEIALGILENVAHEISERADSNQQLKAEIAASMQELVYLVSKDIQGRQYLAPIIEKLRQLSAV